MSIRRFVLTAAVVVAAVAPARAADPPAVEVRLKSVESLISRFEFFGGLAGKGEEAKQFAGVAKAFSGEKGLEGIDTTKDFGFYASVSQDVADSPVVLMVPIKDKDAFLGLFTGKLSITPKKGDDGSYAIELPMLPKPVYFRFANGYAYATFGDAKNLAPAGLISPEKFFAANTDALLAVTVHMDRIPDEMKKVAFGQFELKVAEEKAKKKPNESPAEQLLKEFFMDGIVAGVKSAMFEGKVATFALSVEPKSDDLSVEWSLAPKPGSALEKALKANGSRSSTAAARLKASGLANFTGVKLAVPDDMLPALGKLADALAEQGLASAKPEAKDIAKEALDAGLASLRKGELDFGFAATRPRADGTVGMTAALKVVKGKDAEAVLRKVAAFAPADQAAFTFDVAKLDGADLHKVEIKGAGAEHIKGITGSDTIWFAVGDDLVVVGTDEAAVKAAVAAKPGPVSAIQSDTALAAIMAVQNKADPKPATTEALKTAFGDKPATGSDTIKLTVETGDTLKVSLKVKGAVVNFLRMMGEAKNK
ncbi:MAG TPA: hypothetical protein VGJ05_22515 [Fimbriiglobus sp.]|jgi:hypothetical protein